MPDKKLMLYSLGEACKLCGMCELGWSAVDRNGIKFDPHVFGWFDKLGPIPDIMVVGQNPGWNEIRDGIPFVGQAGKIFDNTIDKFGGRYSINRGRFYISNVLKCYTANNAQPLPRQLERCEPFLKMEVNIIHPKLIIALGAIAFDVLCPGRSFTDGLGKITNSDKFSAKVFATYHPSPLNFDDKSRFVQFEHDIELLCKLISCFDLPF